MAANLTYNTETELSSVNSILAAIGQAPVTRLYSTDGVELSFQNPEVAYIYQILQECNSDVQNEGWVFNTERDYPLPVADDGTLGIPANVIQLDGTNNYSNRSTDFVSRNGRLYDRLAHTDKFTPGDVYYFDVTLKLPFEDLPSPFRRYITSKASTRAAIQLVSNPQLVQLLQQQEAINRASCVEYECTQGDYNAFGYPDGVSFSSYQPFNALQR